jgi:hypothetical protein
MECCYVQATEKSDHYCSEEKVQFASNLVQSSLVLKSKPMESNRSIKIGSLVIDLPEASHSRDQSGSTGILKKYFVSNFSRTIGDAANSFSLPEVQIQIQISLNFALSFKAGIVALLPKSLI